MGKARQIISMQSKHRSTTDKEERKLEEAYATTDRDQLSTPPAWLINKVARDEWARVTAELTRIDVIGNLDVTAIGGYCNALAKYVDFTKRLAKEPLMLKLPDGSEVVNPAQIKLLELQRKAADEIRKFGRLCGMTIDSRLKAAAIKSAQVDDEVEREFGVI